MSQEPEPGGRSQVPEPGARSKEPEPGARSRSQEPTPRTMSQEPEPGARSPEPEPGARSEEPEPGARSKGPGVRSHGRRTGIHSGIPPGVEKGEGRCPGNETNGANIQLGRNKTEHSQGQLGEFSENVDRGQTTRSEIGLIQKNNAAQTGLDPTRVTSVIPTSPGREFPGDGFPGGEGEEDDIEGVKVPSSSDRMYKMYKMLSRPIGAGGGRVDVTRSIISTSRWKYKCHHVVTYPLPLGSYVCI